MKPMGVGYDEAATAATTAEATMAKEMNNETPKKFQARVEFCSS
jgi:hypothetical protein